MRKAARAIIIEDGKLLVMRRDKHGHRYYTLVGGKLDPSETPEQAVIREVKEETGLTVTEARHVYTELHPEPYNEQYIFVCKVAPHGEVAVQDSSEEALMNRIDINIHTPEWIDARNFEKLPFNTMRLQQAIVASLQSGQFPETPQEL